MKRGRLPPNDVKKIRELRELERLSYQAIAFQVGCSVSTVRNVVKGATHAATVSS